MTNRKVKKGNTAKEDITTSSEKPSYNSKKNVDLEKIIFGCLQVQGSFNLEEFAKKYNTSKEQIEICIFTAVADQKFEAQIKDGIVSLKKIFMDSSDSYYYRGRRGSRRNSYRDRHRIFVGDNNEDEENIQSLYGKAMDLYVTSMKHFLILHQQRDIDNKAITSDELFEFVKGIPQMERNVLDLIIKIALTEKRIRKVDTNKYLLINENEDISFDDNDVEDERRMPFFLREQLRRRFRSFHEEFESEDELFRNDTRFSFADLMLKFKVAIQDISTENKEDEALKKIDQLITREDLTIKIRFAEIMWMIYFDENALIKHLDQQISEEKSKINIESGVKNQDSFKTAVKFLKDFYFGFNNISVITTK
jgi:hypothetical protein